MNKKVNSNLKVKHLLFYLFMSSLKSNPWATKTTI